MGRQENDVPAAAPEPRAELEAKFERLQQELEEMTHERAELEARIEDLQKQATSLQAKHSDVCEAEGRLRGQIGALKRALRALER